MAGSPYLMRASSPARLYVISASGTVQREFVIKPPEREMRPSQMNQAGPNSLFMELGYTGTPQDPHPRSTLALFDLDNSQVYGNLHCGAERRVGG